MLQRVIDAEYRVGVRIKAAQPFQLTASASNRTEPWQSCTRGLAQRARRRAGQDLAMEARSSRRREFGGGMEGARELPTGASPTPRHRAVAQTVRQLSEVSDGL